MGSAAEGKAQALKKNVSGQPEAGILQMPGITADRSMYDEEKYEFYQAETYRSGYSVAFKEIDSGNTISYSATCNTFYHDFESMVKSCKSNVEEEFMLDYIEVNAFERRTLYSTDGMTTALEFMYDDDTKIYFQVPGNLSEEEILAYAEDFVF